MAKELITLEEAVAPMKTDHQKRISDLAKGSFGGAFSGAAFGFIYGYSKDKNMYVTTIVGMMIGGVISAIMIGSFNKKKA